MAGYRMLTACLLGNSCAPQAFEMEPTSVRAGAQAVHFHQLGAAKSLISSFLKSRRISRLVMLTAALLNVNLSRFRQHLIKRH